MLATSSTHRDTLIRALSQIRVETYTTLEGLIHTMIADRATCIVFSTDDLPSEGSDHTHLITTQRVLFYTFNSISFKHFCVVILHLYSNWHVKDLAMTSNHICG